MTERPPGGPDDFALAATVLIGGPVLLGRLVRSRMRLNQALREKAEAVERDRAGGAAGAVVDERRRIAGELHHLISDALESMVGQAAAAERLALAPQPSLAHVTDLIARVRASGLPVELDVRGTQAPRPAGLDLTAYRVVQEALGGASEALDARRAAVRLRCGGGERFGEPRATRSRGCSGGSTARVSWSRAARANSSRIRCCGRYG